MHVKHLAVSAMPMPHNCSYDSLVVLEDVVTQSGGSLFMLSLLLLR